MNGAPARHRRPPAAVRKLEVLVLHFFDASDGTYGYRRIHADLADAGVPAGLKLVPDMREPGLVPRQPRPWRAGLTEQDGTGEHIPDLIRHDFTITPRPSSPIPCSDLGCANRSVESGSAMTTRWPNPSSPP
jgi:hypothetical protein